MTGFQSFNDAGALQVDSNNPFTFVKSVLDITSISYHYNIGDPWAGERYGAIPGFSTEPGDLYWLQLKTNRSGGFAGYQPNGGRIIRTSRSQAPVSGYLDVFNEDGNLVWTARSAANSPRVRGVIQLNASTPIDSTDYALAFPSSPFILINNILGEISDDGEVVGWSGLVFRWDGTRLRIRWLNNLQAPFRSYAANRGGATIPYANFANYP